MNPFFWLMILISMVAVWFGIRGLFIGIGSEVVDVIQDTKNILNSNEAVEEKNNEIMEEMKDE